MPHIIILTTEIKYNRFNFSIEQRLEESFHDVHIWSAEWKLNTRLRYLGKWFGEFWWIDGDCDTDCDIGCDTDFDTDCFTNCDTDCDTDFDIDCDTV